MKLRLTEGVSIFEIKEKFNVDFYEKFEEELARLFKFELLEKYVLNNLEFVRLTKKGMDLANQVWQEFV